MIPRVFPVGVSGKGGKQQQRHNKESMSSGLNKEKIQVTTNTSLYVYINYIYI